MAQTETARVYEELLLTLVRGGDRRAADRLAARWQPRLLRTARRLLGDEELARDAAQEAWVGICRGWLRLRDPAKFPAWAYCILRRKCADRIKQLPIDRVRSDELTQANEPVGAARAETLTAIDQALMLLSPDHRIAAILFFGEGLTLSEITDATSVPLGTAKSRIFNARQQMKAALIGEDR